MTIRLFAAAALVAAHGLASASAGAAEFIEGTDRMKARAYSPAVITDGGRIVWLAGMGGITDADGKPITDFAGQTRRAFQNIEATLKRAGGTLADIVTMTVFIRNQADGDEFVKNLRRNFQERIPGKCSDHGERFCGPSASRRNSGDRRHWRAKRWYREALIARCRA
jgi:enamine deaminase RidA (YjgF/YER057c/UK114 family)